jgi:hypothetical protein
MTVDGKQINILDLPSRGRTYPTDIEIYVKPMTAKEEMATSLSRFGSTKASYYDSLLESILIKGNFSKKKLLFGDIQFIDLVRRLFTFELEEQIEIKSAECIHCGEPIKVSFMFANDGKCKNFVEFEEFKDDAFNKEYVFSDGLKVEVSPITMDRFIKISRKYLSNIKNAEDMTDYLFAYRAASIVKAEDKYFESEDSMMTFFMKYFSELYKYKDLQLLTKLDEDMAVLVKPFKIECEHCSQITEVGIEPSMRFHQE